MGCRTRDERSKLLRVVELAGSGAAPQTVATLVPDERERLPGRGAWLHPQAACLESAQQRRAFPRALRIATTVDLSAVRAAIQDPAVTAGHGPVQD